MPTSAPDTHSPHGAASISALSQRPSLTIDYTVIPEPGSLALLGLGAAWVFRRRRVGSRSVEFQTPNPNGWGQQMPERMRLRRRKKPTF